MPKLTAVLVVVIAALVAGCGSSSSQSTSAAPAGSSTTAPTTTATTSTAAGGVNPNQRESLPPGDIPDTIAYVPYSVPGAGLTVSAPEGWSRANSATGVTFTDKLNEVQLSTASAGGPFSVASVKGKEVPKLAASVKGFKLQSVGTVQRPAGQAVRIDYLGDSRPNPVTGKVGTLAFERYEFFRRGKEVVLVLSSPQGSDNVDPWRKVTSSLRFTR
jgi:uncharacterized protein YceK